MRIHRLYTDQPLEPGRETTLGDGPAHYLGRVLRAARGQSVVLFNGDGHDYPADVVRLSKTEVVLEVRSRLPAASESWLKVTVVQAVSRGERMDRTLQKCTELGATAFQPVWTERTEVKLADRKLQKRMRHWRGVVISACEQSGRAVVPAVLEPVGLPDWLDTSTPAKRLVLSPDSECPISRLEAQGRIELAIGPEGGFSEAELDRMRASGVLSVGIGPRILRTETAAPAALAVLQALGGDF
ncbi:MAG: 16S rRNA (uracil(1498)-N(3))-methyltransferase [Gammaproteobacteria bacterium]|nr:16S rRNA (uracil(1498)-N(3))-methyltransferase [Gammaproteobacteria bacterium]NNK31741.1 16S rRNA (uracil(1498)-N(3))-methyltransferase [Xanthomonadales bacterium]